MRWIGGGFDNLRKYGKEVGQTARPPLRRLPVKVKEDPLCARCGFKKRLSRPARVSGRRVLPRFRGYKVAQGFEGAPDRPG